MGELFPILPNPGDPCAAEEFGAGIQRTVRVIRGRGVRGLDVHLLAAEVTARWIERHSVARRYLPPTLSFVRRELGHWWRSETRSHFREAAVARPTAVEGDPAMALEDREDQKERLLAIRGAAALLTDRDRRALVLRLRGGTLAEIAQALGGSEARWSRRIRGAGARIARCLGPAASDDLLSAWRAVGEKEFLRLLEGPRGREAGRPGRPGRPGGREAGRPGGREAKTATSSLLGLDAEVDSRNPCKNPDSAGPISMEARSPRGGLKAGL